MKFLNSPPFLVVRNSISPTLSNGSTFSDDIGNKVAVIDVGSGFCKAGLSGDDIPPVVIPTVVGRQRKAGTIPGISANEAFIGKDAKLRREALIFTVTSFTILYSIPN